MKLIYFSDTYFKYKDMRNIYARYEDFPASIDYEKFVISVNFYHERHTVRQAYDTEAEFNEALADLLKQIENIQENQ